MKIVLDANVVNDKGPLLLKQLPSQESTGMGLFESISTCSLAFQVKG